MTDIGILYRHPTRAELAHYANGTPGKAPIWPFLAMDVGEIVVIEGESSYARAIDAAKYARKARGFRFSRKKLKTGMVFERVR